MENDNENNNTISDNLNNSANEEPLDFFQDFDYDVEPDIIKNKEIPNEIYEKYYKNKNNEKEIPYQQKSYYSKRREKTRLREKEKRKEMKENASKLTGEERVLYYKELKEKEKKEEQGLLEGKDSNFKIVLDISYNDCMKDKEIRSLCLQICHCYSLNKYNKNKIDLCLTNYNEVVKKELNKMGANYWYCNFYEDEFFLVDKLTSLKKQFIYLSPDSENVLEEVNENNIYIIGGLVDKSIIKGESLFRVNSINNYIQENNLDIKLTSAKLPLHKYVKDLNNAVLNVNTCCEILSYYMDTKDWNYSINKALPERKKHK